MATAPCRESDGGVTLTVSFGQKKYESFVFVRSNGGGSDRGGFHPRRGGWILVDRQTLRILRDIGNAIDRIANYIEHAAKRHFADRDRDRRSCIGHFRIASEPRSPVPLPGMDLASR